MECFYSHSIRSYARMVVSIGILLSVFRVDAAETELMVAYSGELNYVSLFDLNSASQKNYIEDDIAGDHFELTIDFAVTHGLFSGNLIVQEYDDDTIDESDPLAIAAQQQVWVITAENLRVYEGNLVFGQLDPVNTTDGYVSLVTDELNEGLGYGAQLGVRYYYPQWPIVVQLDANYVSDTYLPDFEHDNLWGLAVNYHRKTAEAEIHADVHIADDPDNILRPVFVGLAGDFQLNPYYKTTVVFQSAYDMTFGVRFERQINNRFWYVQWADPSRDAKQDAITQLGRIYDSPYTPMIYTLELTRIAANTLWLESRVDYKKDRLGVYAEFSKSFIAEDSASEVGGGVTYLSNTGLLYTAKYFNRVVDALSVLPGIQAENYFEFSATYSF